LGFKQVDSILILQFLIAVWQSEKQHRIGVLLVISAALASAFVITSAACLAANLQPILKSMLFQAVRDPASQIDVAALGVLFVQYPVLRLAHPFFPLAAQGTFRRGETPLAARADYHLAAWTGIAWD